VSPVALGRLSSLVPGPDEGHRHLDLVDPGRWLADDAAQPGRWLPFGAGVHACPGRNLGMAQLVTLVSWAGTRSWTETAPRGVDLRRGLAPIPSTVRTRSKRG
jgi:cytochrome P450